MIVIHAHAEKMLEKIMVMVEIVRPAKRVEPES